MKYGSQLNLPEESPMEHSSSQGYSQSQRSEETVEIKPEKKDPTATEKK